MSHGKVSYVHEMIQMNAFCILSDNQEISGQHDTQHISDSTAYTFLLVLQAKLKNRKG